MYKTPINLGVNKSKCYWALSLEQLLTIARIKKMVTINSRVETHGSGLFIVELLKLIQEVSI